MQDKEEPRDFISLYLEMARFIVYSWDYLVTPQGNIATLG